MDRPVRDRRRRKAVLKTSPEQTGRRQYQRKQESDKGVEHEPNKSFKRSYDSGEDEEIAKKSPRKSLEQTSPEHHGQVQKIKDELDRLREELKTEQRAKQDLSRQHQQFRNTIDELQRKLKAEKDAKEDALTRLSSAAASKLRDNNPGITDLSDPNRPLKLAERASELYDNDWTNAMERLEMTHSASSKASKAVMEQAEIRDVHLLRDILTESFTLCRNAANNQLENYSEFVIMPHLPGRDPRNVGFPKLPPELCKPLKDFRKQHASLALDELFTVFSEEVKKSLKMRAGQYKACEVYIKECIQLCWLMAVQDPPVHMDWDYKHGDKFETTTMRSYTHSGNLVDYVVWPVLYLHDNGPLLAKGVVQGMKK